jgi:hypothetical protein
MFSKALNNRTGKEEQPEVPMTNISASLITKLAPSTNFSAYFMEIWCQFWAGICDNEARMKR